MPLVVAAVIALLALAPAAEAAPTPDRGALMSAGTPNFTWQGQQAQAAAPQQSAQGFDPNKCTKNPDYFCDVTLVRLDAAAGTTAELEFAIFDFSVEFADFDLSIFRSDASGTPGELVANGGNLSAAGMEETVKVPEAEPGYYLVTVSYYFSPDATFTGSIKATGIVPPPAPSPSRPPAAQATPSPAPQPLGLSLVSARRTKRAVLVRTRTARRLSNVSLALRDRRGRLVAAGRFGAIKPGTRTLRLRATRKLRAARYELLAIGIDGSEKRSTSFSVRLRG